MKRLLIFLLCGVMLCGCGTEGSLAQTASTETSGNIFETNYNEIYDELFDEHNEYNDLIMNTIFDKLKYKTLKSTIDEDIAYVTTEITSVNIVAAALGAHEEYSMNCLDEAFDMFVKRDTSKIDKIELQSEQIAKLGKNITDAFVVKNMENNTIYDIEVIEKEPVVSSLFQNINESEETIAPTIVDKYNGRI